MSFSIRGSRCEVFVYAVCSSPHRYSIHAGGCSEKTDPSLRRVPVIFISGAPDRDTVHSEESATPQESDEHGGEQHRWCDLIQRADVTVGDTGGEA